MTVRLGAGRRVGRGWVGVSTPIPAPGLPRSRAGRRAALALFVIGTAVGCLALALLLF